MTRVVTKRSCVSRGVARPPGHRQIEPREERTQLCIAWSGFLTTHQAMLAGGYPTLRRAQHRLRVLLDHGHTKVVLQGGALHRPSIHILTDRGREYLIERGMLDREYCSPRLPREQKRFHAIMVRDVFAALAAADGVGRLRLQDFLFEGDLSRREPYCRLGLIPDAVATVTGRSGIPETVCVEADAGTETTTTLRKKFARWRAVFDGWQVPLPTLLVVGSREGRRRTLEVMLREAKLDRHALVLLTSELERFIDRLGTSHAPAARVGRSERRTVVVQLPRVTALSGAPGAAFRALA